MWDKSHIYDGAGSLDRRFSLWRVGPVGDDVAPVF
jgi:hypothetical protein